MSDFLKQCRICLQYLDYSNFYLGTRTKDGYHNWCKACCAVRDKQYREKSQEKIKERGRVYYLKNRETIIAKQLERDANRREERIAYNKEYRVRTLDARKAYEKEYRETHKEQVFETHKKWRQKNIDYVLQKSREKYQQNKEEIKTRIYAYRRANMPKYKVMWARRRAKKRGNGGSHTHGAWEYIKQINDYRCLKCGRREPEIKLTIDHIVPLSLGGTDEIGNLQPLCLSCNCSKQAKIEDYRGKKVKRGKVRKPD